MSLSSDIQNKLALLLNIYVVINAICVPKSVLLERNYALEKEITLKVSMLKGFR